jgi:hypothetical protein
MTDGPRDRWRRGLVVPHRITLALDIRELYGLQVDQSCGTKEPDVDQWEAGEKYPTWEQLLALADLTAFPVEFFTPEPGQVHALGPGVMFVCCRSRRTWNPVVEIPAPILAFTPGAVAATVGACEQEVLF